MEHEGIEAVLAARWPEAKLRESVELKGDAGVRSYVRLHLDGGGAPPTVMAMRFASDGSARGNEESPEAPRRAEIPFLNVGRFLASRGIAVPAIYAAEESHGVILLEDLGDLALAEAAALAPPAEREAVLGPAIDLLAELASLHSADPAGCYAFESEYGRDAIARELQVVATHGLAHARGLGVLSAGDDAPLEEALAPLGDRLASQPLAWMHRDFHCWNLHLDAAGRVRLIDFQDATIGPAFYDLASFLTDRDTDRFVDPELERALVMRWAEAVRAAGGIALPPPERLLEEYFAAVAYRTLRVIGRFGVLALELGKPGYFERYAPRMAKQTMRALDAVGMEDLAECLFERSPIFI